MNNESNRLQTFESWPTDAIIDPQRVAKAGFYYTGRGMEVQCFSCGEKITNWNYGDQVMTKHRQLSPRCPFVQDPNKSGNIPYVRRLTPPSKPKLPHSWTVPDILTDACSGSWVKSNIYCNESTRVDSFRSWPIPYIVSPSLLAKAGFYYLQQGDKVQCAFCSGIVEHWEEGDVPEEEHRRHFPSCPFLFNIPVGNIPLSRDTGNISNLGIMPYQGPKQQKFSTLDSRLNTFGKWPRTIQQKPQDLAEAGFFYTGIDDHVRCFHCDGGLRLWKPSDDPWEEHARWFPNCRFVILIKGKEYIQQSIRQHPPDEISPQLGLEEIGKMPLRDPQCSYQTQTNKDIRNHRHYDDYHLAPFASVSSAGNSQEEAGDANSSEQETSNSSVSTSHVSPLLTNQSNQVSSNSKTLDDIKHSSVNDSNQYKLNSQKNSSDVSLEEENRRLKEARLCKICMDEEVGVVFLSCGHLVTCVNCAPSLQDCPLCRQPIKATVRTFLS